MNKVSWLFLMALSANSSTATGSEVKTLEKDGVKIVYAAPVDIAAAELIHGKVIAAVAAVNGYLHQSNHYKPRPSGSVIRVLIDPDANTPSQIRNTIIIPQARVLAFAHQTNAKPISLAITHEVTHVLAISAYRKSHGRFYDDGLAVYLQAKLDPLPSYPNWGETLQVAVVDAITQRGSAIRFAEAEQLRKNPVKPIDRLTAYLQEGAFTEYFIDTYGLDAYLLLYFGRSEQDVTGKALAALEADWLESLCVAGAASMALSRCRQQPHSQ